MELRPLGFGEIFDRAVTLYIRNFVPFAAIVAVLIVPVAILQYFLDVGSQPQLDAALRIFMHPEHARTEQLPSVLNSPAFVVVFIVLLLVTYAVWPFALNAVAVGVARLYRNRPVEFRACYEVVLRRWLQIFAMIGVDLLVVLGWYVAAIVVILIFAITIAALVAVAPALAFWFGVMAGIIGFTVMLPLFAPLVVALTFSMYSVTIERRGVIESVVLGFSRVFNRSEFWRAVLFSLAVGAVMLGGSAMFGVVGLLAAFAHLPLVEAIIESLARAVITPFAVVLMAIYYFDVRIRREAFDLEASLENLTGAHVA